MAALPLQEMISQSSTFNRQYRRREFRLGDGYATRVEDGLNAKFWRISLNWDTLSEAEVETLQAFFEDIGSGGTFDYQPPTAQAAVKFSVDDSGLQISAPVGDNYSVSLTARQEFDLS